MKIKTIVSLHTHWYEYKESVNSYVLETSLVVQWLIICPPMQGTQIRSLVQDDSPCHGATKLLKPRLLSLCSRTCELQLWKPSYSGACALQQEKPLQWEVHASNKEWPSPATTRKSPRAATKTQCNQNKRRTVWDISVSPSSSLPKYSSMQDSKWIAYLYSGIYRWVAFNIKWIMC